MTPIGPYKSKVGWASKELFIISRYIGNDTEVTYFVVQNNQQYYDGIPFLSLRDAKEYMADNGFEL